MLCKKPTFNVGFLIGQRELALTMSVFNHAGEHGFVISSPFLPANLPQVAKPQNNIISYQKAE